MPTEPVSPRSAVPGRDLRSQGELHERGRAVRRAGRRRRGRRRPRRATAARPAASSSRSRAMTDLAGVAVDAVAPGEVRRVRRTRARLPRRHRRADPEDAGLVGRGGHHAPPAGAADDDGLAAQRRLVALLDGGEERVEVDVEDRRLAAHAPIMTRRPGRIPSPGRSTRPLSTEVSALAPTGARRARVGSWTQRPRPDRPRPTGPDHLPAARRDRPDRPGGHHPGLPPDPFDRAGVRRRSRARLPGPLRPGPDARPGSPTSSTRCSAPALRNGGRTTFLLTYTDDDAGSRRPPAGGLPATLVAAPAARSSCGCASHDGRWYPAAGPRLRSPRGAGVPYDLGSHPLLARRVLRGRRDCTPTATSWSAPSTPSPGPESRRRRRGVRRAGAARRRRRVRAAERGGVAATRRAARGAGDLAARTPLAPACCARSRVGVVRDVALCAVEAGAAEDVGPGVAAGAPAGARRRLRAAPAALLRLRRVGRRATVPSPGAASSAPSRSIPASRSPAGRRHARGRGPPSRGRGSACDAASPGVAPGSGRRA